MKILHITKKYPAAVGGDAVVVFNLREQQVKAGHQVVIVTSNCAEIPNAPGVYKVGLQDQSFKLDAITPRRLISLAILWFRLFAIFGKERPDVVHTHSVDMAFVCRAAAWFYGLPVIHTFHIVTFYDPNQSWLRRKTELWLARSARLKHITAPNTYDTQKLVDAGLVQAKELNNGVDLDFWRPKPSVSNKVFLFLSIGRLEKQKGYEFLIDAVALLAEKTDLVFKVAIIGGGSQLRTLQERARERGVENIVQFLGQQDAITVEGWLARAGAFVLPSIYETTPITLLEAWASGVPVISTPVGILRDLPPGFRAVNRVSAKDKNSLAAAMFELLNNDAKRRELAKYGYLEVQKYSWPLIADKLETLYQ